MSRQHVCSPHGGRQLRKLGGRADETPHSAPTPLQPQVDGATMDIPPQERFSQLERIGRGSFGEVYRGVDLSTREVVAVKIIDLEQAEDEIDDIQQEISVMSQCDSPYVTRYYGSYVSGTKLWIVMEYVGGGSVLVRRRRRRRHRRRRRPRPPT